jgi:hypothetical protein
MNFFKKLFGKKETTQENSKSLPEVSQLEKKKPVKGFNKIVTESYYADDDMAFVCISCNSAVGFPLQIVDKFVGKCIQCEKCENLSHVPGAARLNRGRKGKITNIEIVAGEKMKITDFPNWYFENPLVKDMIANGKSEIHNHYGLYAYCAKCTYEYEHHILAQFALASQAAGSVFNASSQKSAKDMNALHASQCPQCSNSNIVVIARDATDDVIAELNRRLS